MKIDLDIPQTALRSVRAGLRYTKDKKDYFADRIQAPPFSPTFIGRRTANTDVSNTSGDFAATFKIDRNNSIYGRVATGFRAPSIQGRLLFGDQLSVANSEKVTSYEVGYKADLLNRRVRLSAAAFTYSTKHKVEDRLAAVRKIVGNPELSRRINMILDNVWILTDKLARDPARLARGIVDRETPIK